MEYKYIDIQTIPITAGLNQTYRLPTEGWWDSLQFRLAVTTTGSASATTRDGFANLINRMQLRINGTPIWDLPGPDSYHRWAILQGVAGDSSSDFITSTSLASATNPYGTFEIPFALPFPDTIFTGAAGTGAPSGLAQSIELQVVAPAALDAACFTGGTNTITGATLLVTARQCDMSRAKLIEQLAAGGHAYIQNSYLQNIAATGNLDQDLQGGAGILKDIYCRLQNNTVSIPVVSAPYVTNQKLIIGNNDFPIDSSFLGLRSLTVKNYKLAAAPPTGAWMQPFAPNGGQLLGINLNGRPSVKMRTTVSTTVTSVSNQTIITGMLMERMMANIVGQRA